MSKEEMLSLNNYLEDLYQAWQIGDIVFEAKHSGELYNLINKLLEENQKYKEVINKITEFIKDVNVSVARLEEGIGIIQIKKELFDILKEVEHD